MRTFLFAWELGGGMGHMMQILPLARELASRGHKVFVALRDVSRARQVFDEGTISILQSPVRVGPPANPIRPPRTLAHILHNVSFGGDDELAGMVSAWRGMFESVRPDVIIFDHAPTALLASRGLSARRVTIGGGFFCPPDQHPLPNLRHWQPADPQVLAADEAAVLGRINTLLTRQNQPAIGKITRLYAEVDDTFLLTFRELDHYPNRPGNPRYRGIWEHSDGRQPGWPPGEGPKIYAYLKAFPTISTLLVRLKALGHPTLVAVDGMPCEAQRQFAGPRLQFVNERLDIKSVARQCDVVILNANHGTAITLLLAGKPGLHLPIYLEQGLFAGVVARLGAGITAAIEKPQEMCERLDLLLASRQVAQAARDFAAKYARFDHIHENQEMVGRLEELAG